MEGWEVSTDRKEVFEKMINMDSIVEPIITSKCVLGNENGFLIVSDNGFA